MAENWKKFHFFVDSQLWTLLDLSRDEVGARFSKSAQKTPRRFICALWFLSRTHPFFGIGPTNFIVFCHFLDYVITTHTYGHDVIGHSDIWNESSRVDQQGTEVHFTLPVTNKKLRPIRYALISYFCVMLRISTVGNTLNSKQPFWNRSEWC